MAVPWLMAKLAALFFLKSTMSQAFCLNKDQLDMVLLGSISSIICEEDDVGERSGHKPAK